MKREDDPELWDLLGRSADPEISPFFARNVAREVRQLPGWSNLRRWINVRSLVPASGVAVALIAVMLLRMQTAVVPLESESDIFANVDPQDYEVVADLNDVLTSDDNVSFDDSILL